MWRNCLWKVPLKASLGSRAPRWVPRPWCPFLPLTLLLLLFMGPALLLTSSTKAPPGWALSSLTAEHQPQPITVHALGASQPHRLHSSNTFNTSTSTLSISSSHPVLPSLTQTAPIRSSKDSAVRGREQPTTPVLTSPPKTRVTSRLSQVQG